MGIRAATVLLLALVAVSFGANAYAQGEDVGFALARSGTVPIVRVSGSSGDFDVFVESPAARRALYGPMVNGTSIRTDAYWVQYLAGFWHFHTGVSSNYRDINVPQLKLDLAQPVYRVLVNAKTSRNVLVQLLTVVLDDRRPAAREKTVKSIREGGGIGAHWTFDHIPANEFAIAVKTSGGDRRYPVTKEMRDRLR